MRDDFDAIVRCLTEREPVSLSRWGDGEWRCILGQIGQNCDGQTYTRGLRAELAAVLMDRPPYRLALQPFAMRVLGPEITSWLVARNLTPDWIDGELFTRRSQADTLGPFLEALSSRRVVLMGPPYLEALSLFPVSGYVPVPARGAHAVWPLLLQRLKRALDQTGADVVLLSCGMSSNLIVHALSLSHPTVSALDCGSLWEPYVGRATRTYHKAILARERAHA